MEARQRAHRMVYEGHCSSSSNRLLFFLFHGCGSKVWDARQEEINTTIMHSFSPRKPRRQRQRRRGKTKGLMSRTMALQVHYKTLYISQPSSANHYILRIQDNASPDGKFFIFLLENKARLHIFSLR